MKPLFLFIVALAGLIPTQARAELDSLNDSIRAMHQYATCVVHLDPSASGILGVPPGSRAERSLLQRIQMPNCVSGGGFPYFLDFQPQLLRGAIAEEVLRRGDNHRFRGRTLRWAAPFSGLTEAGIAALDDRGRSALRALDFTQCIHAAAPDAVSALLRTPPTTSPEEQAFQQLTPHLGPCLPAGARMTIVRPQLRGFLAEAAYRSAYAASRRAASLGKE